MRSLVTGFAPPRRNNCGRVPHWTFTAPAEALGKQYAFVAIPLFNVSNEYGAASELKGWGNERSPRGNPPTSGIVQHDSHMRKYGSDLAGNRTCMGAIKAKIPLASSVPSSLRAVHDKMSTFESPAQDLLKCMLRIFRLHRYAGNTARLARRSDEALGVRVSLTRIAPSLLDPGRAVFWREIQRDMAPVNNAVVTTCGCWQLRASRRSTRHPARTLYSTCTATSNFSEVLLKFYFQDIPPFINTAGFLGDLPFPSPPLFRRCSILASITLIGSQDLAKSRPNLFIRFTHFTGDKGTCSLEGQRAGGCGGERGGRRIAICRVVINRRWPGARDVKIAWPGRLQPVPSVVGLIALFMRRSSETVKLLEKTSRTPDMRRTNRLRHGMPAVTDLILQGIRPECISQSSGSGGGSGMELRVQGKEAIAEEQCSFKAARYCPSLAECVPRADTSSGSFILGEIFPRVLTRSSKQVVFAVQCTRRYIIGVHARACVSRRSRNCLQEEVAAASTCLVYRISTVGVTAVSPHFLVVLSSPLLQPPLPASLPLRLFKRGRSVNISRHVTRGHVKTFNDCQGVQERREAKQHLIIAVVLLGGGAQANGMAETIPSRATAE
ncbi:hypothetical protein PR048_008564 [Dryococelus australis]|uniref:Uncharacterized protein n=1 Tax=Dryococelus australis TaxID=614101 RepID=A0ABQ9HXJ4_9NEOP|nr:hypothetical protein PR048_008564 [Dryococelus australis]